MPTGVAVFNEINRPPRVLAEPYYNIQRWVEIDDGGHFPAMENPDALGARAPRVLPPPSLGAKGSLPNVWIKAQLPSEP